MRPGNQAGSKVTPLLAYLLNARQRAWSAQTTFRSKGGVIFADLSQACYTIQRIIQAFGLFFA